MLGSSAQVLIQGHGDNGMPEQTTTPLYSQQDTNPSDSVRN